MNLILLAFGIPCIPLVEKYHKWQLQQDALDAAHAASSSAAPSPAPPITPPTDTGVESSAPTSQHTIPSSVDGQPCLSSVKDNSTITNQMNGNVPMPTIATDSSSLSVPTVSSVET
jgi:hypothetical protein